MAHAGNRQFGAAKGARFDDDDAQEYGEFLDSNGLLDGPVDADEIVDLARPKKSPIHNVIFDRNRADAAHEYYKGKARELVRHIVVYKEDEEGEAVETRAYHHVTVKGKGKDEKVEGYVSETVVWQRPDLANQVIEKAFKELLAWRNRYKQYSQFRAMIAAIDDFIDEQAA